MLMLLTGTSLYLALWWLFHFVDEVRYMVQWISLVLWLRKGTFDICYVYIIVNLFISYLCCRCVIYKVTRLHILPSICSEMNDNPIANWQEIKMGDLSSKLPSLSSTYREDTVKTVLTRVINRNLGARDTYFITGKVSESCIPPQVLSRSLFVKNTYRMFKDGIL